MGEGVIDNEIEATDQDGETSHASRLSRRRLFGGGLAIAGTAAVGSFAGAAMFNGTADGGTSPTTATPTRSPATEDPAAPEYLGYRRADYQKPYAKYFTETTAPVQDNIRRAVLQPPAAVTDVPSLEDLATEINTPGYSKVETGYAMLPSGSNFAAALTSMPGVTPEMWDWWFGWHSLETARYKLWHPEAHLHAGLLHPLADEPGLTDKQKYIGNTSYADEYLPDYHGAQQYLGDKRGGILVNPGITFIDPADINIDLSKFDGTAIVGRGGTQGSPDTITLFVHQVRRTKDGCEMRSRFYVNGAAATAVRPEDAQAAANAKVRAALPATYNVQGFFNMLHAGQEMNHLSLFLPALYKEFRRT